MVIDPSAEELEALAKRFKICGINSMTSTIEVQGGSLARGVKAVGSLDGEVRQICTLSG